jgi:predicted HTH domain antitoxin
MAQATIAIPPFVTESEVRLYLSMKLFDIGRLSCGQAAELAGYSKRTYMELLDKHRVSAIDYPASELLDDLGHACGPYGSK